MTLTLTVESKHFKEGEELALTLKNLENPGTRNFLVGLGVCRDLLTDVSTLSASLASRLVGALIAAIPSVGANQATQLFRVVAALSSMDPVVRIFLKKGFYAELARCFGLLMTAGKTGLSKYFRLMLTKGRAIRVITATACPNLADSLLEAMKAAKGSTGLTVDILDDAGMVLCLIPQFPGSPAIPYAFHSVILEALKPGVSEEMKARALDCLIFAAEIDECRAHLYDMGLLKAVSGFLERPDSPEAFVACLIEGLLSASDDCTTISASARVVVQRVVETLDIFSAKKVKNVQTMGDNNVLSKTLLIALRSLAMNESNKAILCESNMVASLLAFVKARRLDLLEQNSETLEQVFRLVWTLGFEAEFRKQLKQEGADDLVASFEGTVTLSEDENVTKAFNGAKWALAEGERHPHAAAAASATHIMISYSWGQKERMRSLASVLQNAGFPVWIDIEQMEGSVLGAMAEAVEGASVVLVGLSSSYKESQACRTEAEYAYTQKKPLVFVQAEDGYSAKGWLGALLGNQLWLNPWKNDAGFEVGALDVLKNLKKFTSGAGSTSTLKKGAVTQRASTLPTDLENLPAGELTKEQAVLWDNLKVLRWLRTIVAEENYLTAFLAHQMTGQSLLELSRGGSQGNFLAVLHHMGLTAVGPALKFYGALRSLMDPTREVSDWSTSKVLAWLERGNFPRLASKAREAGWKGKVLMGLYESSNDDSFGATCRQLGLDALPDQLELKVELKKLFF